MTKWINADALRAELEEDANEARWREEWERAAAFDAVLEDMKRHETDDVAPVVHARWKPITVNWYDGHLWRCTNCGGERVLGGASPHEQEMNYCPRCGARMDLEG